MVKTTATSATKLASIARSQQGRPDSARDDKLRAQFTSAAIGMSWQLMIIVLVPIIGGYKLDEHLATLPVWTLVGLVVALIGSIVVIRRAVTVFGDVNPAVTVDQHTESK